MTTGEVKAKAAQTNVVPLKSEQNNQTEFIEMVVEKEVFVKEKLVSNPQARERFSRLKKSLRRKSVSIL
ncbi:hypothetical protein BH20ACI1_BH20ACI1_13300 [soil metagenome]